MLGAPIFAMHNAADLKASVLDCVQGGSTRTLSI